MMFGNLFRGLYFLLTLLTLVSIGIGVIIGSWIWG